MDALFAWALGLVLGKIWLLLELQGKINARGHHDSTFCSSATKPVNRLLQFLKHLTVWGSAAQRRTHSVPPKTEFLLDSFKDRFYFSLTANDPRDSSPPFSNTNRQNWDTETRYQSSHSHAWACLSHHRFQSQGLLERPLSTTLLLCLCIREIYF